MIICDFLVLQLIVVGNDADEVASCAIIVLLYHCIYRTGILIIVVSNSTLGSFIVFY